MKRINAIARCLGALKRCQESNNNEWAYKHAAALAELLDPLPSGSGIDSGTVLDESSTPDRLVFVMDYHHMDEGGCYDGWTTTSLIFTPSFELGYHIRVTGSNRNDIGTYLVDTITPILDEDIPEWTGYEQPANVQPEPAR